MEILQHIWGSTPEGEGIIMYTMRNSRGSEVQLCNIGASIVGVKFADRNGNIEDVALGYRDPESYIGDGAASGKSVGRVAGRIARGRMVVDGVEYRLEVNNGPNHLHGGSKGFANRYWEGRVETNRVVFSYVAEDMEQGYPGELIVEAVYDFDDEDNLEITYLAKSNKTTVVNLTNHLYWNLHGEASGKSILDHELRLNCSKVLEMDTVQIPTGTLLDVEGTPLDFTTWRKFGTDIDAEFNNIRNFRGYDHCFAVDGWQKNILQEVGELRCEATGRKVTILSSQPAAVLYTGNWLAGGCPVTKSGGRYDDYAGVAIECQAYSDAVNHPHFPSIELQAEELYCQKIVFKLGTF
ncbi:MAG: galactose mutarotase [Alistipes sp.]|nr:galactose mutarotase [Alistipes sp.]